MAINDEHTTVVLASMKLPPWHTETPFSSLLYTKRQQHARREDRGPLPAVESLSHSQLERQHAASSHRCTPTEMQRLSLALPTPTTVEYTVNPDRQPTTQRHSSPGATEKAQIQSSTTQQTGQQKKEVEPAGGQQGTDRSTGAWPQGEITTFLFSYTERSPCRHQTFPKLSNPTLQLIRDIAGTEITEQISDGCNVIFFSHLFQTFSFYCLQQKQTTRARRYLAYAIHIKS